MARSGKPGSIRGEAARRGISEYQIRKEREFARAESAGTPPDLARAAGKGTSQRRRDLAKLNRILQRTYPKESPTYKETWRATRYTYDQYGYQMTEQLLVMQGLNTQYYLGGSTGAGSQLDFGWRMASSIRRKYADIPDSMFWYHGPLG